MERCNCFAKTKSGRTKFRKINFCKKDVIYRYFIFRIPLKRNRYSTIFLLALKI